MAAFSVDAFRDLDEFKREVTEFAEYLTSTPPGRGVRQGVLPGRTGAPAVGPEAARWRGSGGRDVGSAAGAGGGVWAGGGAGVGVRGRDWRASDMAEPFRIDVPEADLVDLRRRIAATRWPDEVDGAAWDYGSNLGYMRALADYWLNGFDWREQERRLNELPQFTADVDGQLLHFVHVRGPRAQSDAAAHHARLAEHLLGDVQVHPAADGPGLARGRCGGRLRRGGAVHAGVRILGQAHRARV